MSIALEPRVRFAMATLVARERSQFGGVTLRATRD
jgi:hypothetical protein